MIMWYVCFSIATNFDDCLCNYHGSAISLFCLVSSCLCLTVHIYVATPSLLSYLCCLALLPLFVFSCMCTFPSERYNIVCENSCSVSACSLSLYPFCCMFHSFHCIEMLCGPSFLHALSNELWLTPCEIYCCAPVVLVCDFAVNLAVCFKCFTFHSIFLLAPELIQSYHVLLVFTCKTFIICDAWHCSWYC